jgi:hypothetical protein
VSGDHLDRRHDEGEVGILGLAEWRRHTDIERVEVAHGRRIDRRAEAAGRLELGDIGRRHVLNVRSARIDCVHLAGVEVDANGRQARAREFDCQGQSDVPETDDPDAGRSIREAGSKRRCQIRGRRLFRRGCRDRHERKVSAL